MSKVPSGNVSAYSHLSPREDIAQGKAAENSGSLKSKNGALSSLKTKFSNFKAMITGGESKKAVAERLARNTYSGPLTPEQTKAAFKNIHEQRLSKLPKRPPSQSADNKQLALGSSKNRPPVINKLLIIDPPTTSNARASQSQIPVATSQKNSLPPTPEDDPGPPSPSYIPTPPTPEQLDGQAATHNDAHSLRGALSNGLTQALQGEHGNLIDKEDIQKFSDNLSTILGLKPGKLSLNQFSALGDIKSEIEAFLPPDVKSKFDALMQAEEMRLMKDLGMT